MSDMNSNTDIALKKLFAQHLAQFSTPGVERWKSSTQSFFAPKAVINTVHPFNASTGPDAHWGSVYEPLLAAFDGLFRRVDILMGGRFEDADWVSATGYLVGHFQAPFLGIRPTNMMAHLRFGEFHRIENGQAVESYIFLDIPELMMAAGQWPLPMPPGFTGVLLGPPTQDGMQLHANDPAQSARSFRQVTEMLSKLNTPDEAWRPYWHPNMLWYGPAAFGSYLGVDRFSGFQRPFEQCFEGWAGGAAGTGRTRHFTRFGDGLYTCSGGWPSLSGTSIRPFLGQEPTGKMTFFRVCDWWRREGDLLMENWIFVDIPYAMLQFGVDVFEPRQVR
jgi:hypothetical protein